MGNVPSDGHDVAKDAKNPHASSRPSGRQVYGEPASSAYPPYGAGQQPPADMDTRMDLDIPNPPNPSSSSSTPPAPPPLTPQQENTVPTVFRWEHGGRSVFITGTFNSWTRQIRMHRSGADFTYIHDLTPGKHAFKFIVDDEWRFAPDQPTVADVEGRINNFIDVTDFRPFHGDNAFESRTLGDGSEVDVVTGSGCADGDESWGLTIPTVDEYTKEPPPLPPHLRHIILNKAPFLTDTAALPTPQHVALNHLYCTAIKDNMMVLGVTGRFRDKFVTTVYYSPCK